MAKQPQLRMSKCFYALLFSLSASQVHADAITDGKFNFICATRYLCNDYGNASEECATAGNFEKCVEIKVGSEANYALSMMCNTDGSINSQLLAGFQQRGIEESTISMADTNCYVVYAELTTAETLRYRPSIYESMLSWKKSLDQGTTPFIYNDILQLSDMGR